ncbi:valine--tRNA ligase [Nitrospira sp. Kam-Ns4a]
MPLRQLEKTYDPAQVEERWYRFWTERGYFHAAVDHPGSPYTIVIPPPNVTGSLHIGHALNNTIQDILIRWRRMQGRNTLWLPGTDHAGIATQNVVERQLLAEGTTREALGRDAFIQRVWAWKAKAGGTIIEQLKRLGASCDWDRLRFTMDEGLSRAVREVFVRLHEDGLIYRGERLINWCPRCLTALSDIEVEHEEQTGQLYHIRYPVADEQAPFLTVATTRPETLLGDTAVAVHPEDPRYRHLIGRRVRLPLTDRTIPIVGDPILVDREFGTGAVKITPAHDFNDFEAGGRHGLPRIALLDEEARFSAFGLQRAAIEASLRERLLHQPVHKARAIVADLLKERGLVEKVEPHRMALGKCYRCKTVVEPFLSPQWFVKIKPLAEPAIQAVEDGRIRIVPEGWKNNYLGWMRDIKDWCISRQIWWGHQIPAWYCTKCDAHAGWTAHAAMATAEGGRLSAPWVKSDVFGPEATPIVSRTTPTRCPRCGNTDLVQDPDVLDTWFSSALWPFSTLGWPEQTPELKTFYPTSTLVTGLDILFFWVARMIMMGLKFTGQAPFRDVYIHALVRDAEGQKMSKSKGNVVDPLEVMDRYGTDALRFTLASLCTPGRDIKLVREVNKDYEGGWRAPQIEGYRNFANKLWNAARFILMHLDGPAATVPPADRTLPDRWILSRLNDTIRQVGAALEEYRFDQAARRVYQFVWHEYCDWYLELIKPVLSKADGPVLQAGDSMEARRIRGTIVETFEATLRLLHPFMPFITEEIWQALPHEGESLVVRPYPTPVPAWDAPQAEAAFRLLEQAVTTARTGRALLAYPPGKSLAFYAVARDPQASALLGDLHPHLESLSRGAFTLAPIDQWPAGDVLRLAVEGLTIGVRVEGDVDLRKALDRITKQQADNAKELQRVEAKLGSREFTEKAPPEVVAEHAARVRLIRHEQAILASSEGQLRMMLEAGGR